MRIRSVELLFEMPYCFHRVIHFAAGMSRAGLGKRRDKARVIGAGERNHGVTVRVGRHASSMLVRRTSCGDELDFVEVKAALGGARNRQVADMDRIKRAAEQRNSAPACMT